MMGIWLTGRLWLEDILGGIGLREKGLMDKLLEFLAGRQVIVSKWGDDVTFCWLVQCPGFMAQEPITPKDLDEYMWLLTVAITELGGFPSTRKS